MTKQNWTISPSEHEPRQDSALAMPQGPRAQGKMPQGKMHLNSKHPDSTIIALDFARGDHRISGESISILSFGKLAYNPQVDGIFLPLSLAEKLEAQHWVFLKDKADLMERIIMAISGVCGSLVDMEIYANDHGLPFTHPSIFDFIRPYELLVSANFFEEE